MFEDDRRLIEDYLPIQARGYLSKALLSILHRWWARRPLVACRAAVYAALVPADQFRPANGPEEKRDSLARANAATFLERLCRRTVTRKDLEAAAAQIREANGGQAPRVLDQFAGGGSIPLEAARLGCEVHALELNPVAHLVELATLVYPAKYGSKLVEEVRRWSQVVFERARAEVGDLYPPLPDPNFKAKEQETGSTGGSPVQSELFVSRRNLPHWELGGSTYFVTYRCAPGVSLDGEDKTIVLDNWRHWHGEKYLLHAAVVMLDHVHVLITPLKAQASGLCHQNWIPLAEILHTNKSFTAHQINKAKGYRGKVWQDERFDRIVRDEAEFLEKWNYIANNPVKAGLGEGYSWLFQNPEGWAEGGAMGQGSTGPGSPGRWPVLPGPPGSLIPVAYLWTRTVPCKNCSAVVPLHRQTWLRKKAGGFVALRPVAVGKEKRVSYELLESAARDEKQAVASWGFDPTDLSKGGETECLFCRSVVATEHVKACGKSGRMGIQLMAVVATRKGERGKVYLSVEQASSLLASTGKLPVPPTEEIQRRLEALLKETGLTLNDASLPQRGALGFRVQPYGFKTWDQLFTPRQLLTLLTFVKHVRAAHEEMIHGGMDNDLARAVATYLAFVVDKVAERCTIGVWHCGRETVEAPIREGKMPMTWDFPEANPFGGSTGSWESQQKDVIGVLEALVADRFPVHRQDACATCTVRRGSALALPYQDGFFDAIITDPPYYDNVPYSYLADFFYVWLKRSIGHLYPEHLAGVTSPVKAEAVMDPSRHGGKKEKAKEAYESMMAQAFAEARRVLKPGAPLVCVYAHKTTAGWATLVDALRKSGFVVTEAWPLDTENPSRQRSKESAALASSIFLVARKREGAETGSYEEEVRPELERIVRERVETLWDMGIAGADLVIAAVGAGLRAFTRFASVEYANGEEVPVSDVTEPDGRRRRGYLSEVEGLVLETLLEKIFKVGQASSLSDTGKMPMPLGQVDGSSRFYVLWRYTYKAAELEAGEAIVFTYGQPMELDGPNGLSTGSRALVEKKKGKYRLRDFTERGRDEKLGLPVAQASSLGSSGKMPKPLESAPLIDVLHRILWLMENEPRNLPRFLDEARPDRERLRLVAQALAGPGLKGKSEEAKALVTTTASEQAALGKLLANWRALIETPLGASTLFNNRSDT